MEKYELDEQQFGVGDIARLDQFTVKVTEVIQDEDGIYYYEVEPVDFNSIRREVRQDKLSPV